MKNMGNDDKGIKIHKILGDVVDNGLITEVKKLKGDIVQGNKYLIKGGIEAPPQDHPNGRDCPQCEGWTWKHTRECVHCGCDIPTVESKEELRKQQELAIQNELRQQQILQELKRQRELTEEPKTLWDVSSNELIKEHKYCKKQKMEVYSKRFIPLAITVCGFAISIYLMINLVLPNMFSLKHTDWYLIYGVIFGLIFPSTIWLNKVRNRDDKLVSYYKERIEIIVHILRVRGDL
ncbi:hypothetical protein ACM9OC_07355 [Acinetobacter baumannii]|uniref:hypothetical protein n=1 Tax=Acinetobacter baumannii TaxID=470 RepID=UPI003A4C51E7